MYANIIRRYAWLQQKHFVCLHLDHRIYRFTTVDNRIIIHIIWKANVIIHILTFNLKITKLLKKEQVNKI